jgi:alkaline phosphatase D
MNRRTFLVHSLASFTVIACGSEDSHDETTASVPNDPKKPVATLPSADAGGDSAPIVQPPPAPVPTSPAAYGERVFPQGLASGDPRPDRVILWCRAEPSALARDAGDDIELEVLVARDEALTDIVLRQTVRALAADDHTVRVVPTGLESGRHYYYRFAAGTVTTLVGRTKTAPADGSDVPVRFAFCSCQDFIGRYYHSWKALLDEPDLDFVMFLGDYIYESVGDARFQSPSPDREIKLPDGLDTSPEQDKSRIAAGTLNDYRALYRAYRSDAHLREVHRRYPFIITWDDHEFADDCWRDHSTSYNELDPITKKPTTERNPPRRHAANRAFSEYQPAEVTFNGEAAPPDDIKIYRSLRWGKHVELFMTDERGYRDDHLIPEGPIDLAVGKLSANSSMGSRYFVRKSVFDAREAAKKPTLLGAAQKKWLLDGLRGSTATWKFWGNEVQVYQMALNLGLVRGIPNWISYTVYVNADQWDGFRSEREEVLTALKDANVSNLVVCTGDIHSFWAAELYPDFDAPSGKPVAVEYVTAGISSSSLGVFVQKLIPSGSVLSPLAQSWTSVADAALLGTNPYLKYADSDSYGFSVVSVDASAVDVTFVELGDPTQKTSTGVRGRRKFRTRSGTNRIERL